MSYREGRRREFKHNKEEAKAKLRRAMEGGSHIYLEEHYRDAKAGGNEARAAALDEMADEINAHNRTAGGPDFPRKNAEALRRETERREHQRKRGRDLEEAQRIASGPPPDVGGGIFAAHKEGGDVDKSKLPGAPRKRSRRPPHV